jgi:exosortase/archaeosortase family protein
MISCGVYSFYCENNYKNKENLSIFKISYSFLLLSMILYRSLWLHVGDNFIYILFPGLYLSLLMLYSSINNVIKNYKPFLISLILPICKGLFIPLSIIFSPLSSFFTWLLLNTVGFSSVLKGQEIFYNNRGINVTFSCSGSGQILFSLSAMIILNFCFPLRNLRIFIFQLILAFLFTFAANIIRLSLLALFVHTENLDGFSMFDYLHGGSGGLIFAFLSMTLSCESYKRLYLRTDISNEINY